MARKTTKKTTVEPRVIMPRRAFDDVQDTPCPVCLELAQRGEIQARAVMPLPKFPARLKSDNRQCCRDCQATETSQSVLRGQHPMFGPARLVIANERCEGLVMPKNMMENFGLCALRIIAPCSMEDLQAHLAWLKRHEIPNNVGCEPFGPGVEEEDE